MLNIKHVIFTDSTAAVNSNLGVDKNFPNQQTTMYFPLTIYQSYVTALAIPFFWGIWKMMEAGFYYLSKNVRLDIPWYVYILNTL